MSAVCCYDVRANPVYVSPEAVAFSPAVYGIFIEGRKVLLSIHPQTDLWHPPGCLLGPRETPVQAIRRHFHAMTGFLPQMGPVIHVEDQFRIDEEGQAWHLSILYYALDRPLGRVISMSPELGKQAEMVAVDELKRSQMQFGYEAVQAGSVRLDL
jgi:ADP-ribose pyrophosphatase YjhB (NUDIX family)